MNEAEWLKGWDPFLMWEYLEGRPRVDQRKVRLWVRAVREVIDAAAEGHGIRRRWSNPLLTRADVRRAGYDVARANAWLEEAPKALRAALLRDVFGNPFRPNLYADGCHLCGGSTVSPHGMQCGNCIEHKRKLWAWRAWDDGTVANLAQVICAGRRWEDLPVLADALLDAGCADEGVLGHLHFTGPHCAGCWVLDMLNPAQTVV